MINLKIDPEFQNQIPPLTDDEFKQLEENILKEGKLLSPLIVWGNTLVDGHNRYAILQKHPEICFSTMPLRFENREEAIACPKNAAIICLRKLMNHGNFSIFILMEALFFLFLKSLRSTAAVLFQLTRRQAAFKRRLLFIHA